jgi:hypothetical protein
LDSKQKKLNHHLSIIFHERNEREKTCTTQNGSHRHQENGGEIKPDGACLLQSTQEDVGAPSTCQKRDNNNNKQQTSGEGSI